MKKLITIIGILVLVSLMVAPVFAHRCGGSGYHAGSGPGACWQDRGAHSNLTEVQRAELVKLEQKYFNDSAKMRDEIWTKSGELDNLLNAAEPDANKARTLQREISDLKAKMAENRLNFQLEARKIAPNIRAGHGPRMGYGRGHGWDHHHGAHAHQGPQGGYGHGPCWNQ
jgi:zinc resistance-associated protein